jgi:glycolate oxidase iron-sulfur subunit
MLRLAPSHLPHRPRDAQIIPAFGQRKGRVAMLAGCINDLIAPQINASTIGVLTRHGYDVVLASDAGCCGSLVHHMGRDEEALVQARANVDAWSVLENLDAIIVNTSGCGTTVKDYGFMLRTDPAYAKKAAHISSLTKDITEFLADLPLTPRTEVPALAVAYHSACSLQHGQSIRSQPKELLRRLGFTVKEVPDGHLCCGSAGTYNILQPAIATRLRERKVESIESTRPDVIAAGNIGCITQIAAGTELPIVHTIELIDWATGGPCPAALGSLGSRMASGD